MRYVAAYLLAALGGSAPTSGDLEKILGSVGIEVDEDRVKQVMSSLSGKDLAEVIEAGRARLGSVPTGGAVAAAPAAAASGEAAPAAAVEEAKEEAKKADSDDESGSDDDMGFGLFD
jgi:large subunit ribosomal protein LP2